MSKCKVLCVHGISNMGIKSVYLVSLYLITSAFSALEHEPKVYEELDEHPPAYVRRTRHLDANQKFYQPPTFNYRTTVQQDRMKSKYYRQHQADTRNIKINPVNPDVIFRLHHFLDQKPMSILFDENSNDWKPFQPRFLNSAKPLPINEKKKLTIPVKQKSSIKDNAYKNDLDVAGSETQQQEVKSESQYIYVSPNLLRKDFGLDSKTTQQILQNSAPGSVQTNDDNFQISELQELLGKNPTFQLQGLQRILEEAKPIADNNLPMSGQKDITGIQIEHNGSPSLDSLQQQIDAVNKAQEEKVLAAAQKQAEAHVQAQHQALVLAQTQAHEEAFAKIAAHNQGISTLNPTDHLEDLSQVTQAQLVVPNHQTARVLEPGREINQNSLELQQQGDVEHSEVLALQDRPTEQVLVHPEREYGEDYAPAVQDLHNVKSNIGGVRGRFYRPALVANSASPPLYNQKQVQIYSPVSPYTPHLSPQNDIGLPTIIPQPTQPTLVNLPTIQEQIEPSATSGKQLYEGEQTQYEDFHQYAAKYAFGYRILDEEHGNDFGHEEERNGKLTKGHYYVRLPDGRKQRVEYYADNSGYHARVSYENVGVHPYVIRQKTESAEQINTVHK